MFVIGCYLNRSCLRKLKKIKYFDFNFFGDTQTKEGIINIEKIDYIIDGYYGYVKIKILGIGNLQFPISLEEWDEIEEELK